MSQWWRVKTPDSAAWEQNEGLVLVVGNRIAAFTCSYGLEVGDRWDEKRRDLERAQFTCTMETL